MFEHDVWTHAVLGVLYACVLYFCVCTCSAQLSILHIDIYARTMKRYHSSAGDGINYGNQGFRTHNRVFGPTKEKLFGPLRHQVRLQHEPDSPFGISHDGTGLRRLDRSVRKDQGLHHPKDCCDRGMTGLHDHSKAYCHYLNLALHDHKWSKSF